MKRAYTTTHTYEAGRDGLLEMKNELNVGLVTNPNTTPMTRGNPWTAARHQYELNTLGQRTSHEETLSEAGNFNGWVGYDRRVKRDFVYDAKGQPSRRIGGEIDSRRLPRSGEGAGRRSLSQVTSATAAYPNGNNASAGYGFLGDPASEAEVYSYDAIGNRTGAQFPKRPVDASGNLEYGWNFGTPPATGESNTYPATSKANTYGAVNRTNQGYASGTAPPAAATLKYDADGNLLEDGEFVYTWDGEPRRLAGAETDCRRQPRRGAGAVRRRRHQNRLLSIDPVAPTPGAYGECRYRFGYDYRSRRVRRQVDFWAGIWLTKTVNRFVYHGWSRGEGSEPRQTIRRIAPQGLAGRAEARQSTFLALDYHQDFCVYNDTVGQTEGIDKGSYGGGLSPVRTDRYIWGQDVSGTLQGAGGVGGLLMAQMQGCHYWNGFQVTTPQVLYYQYDGNGNISSLLDSSGNHLCHLRYDSFGNRLTQPLAGHWYPWVFNQPWGFSTKWTDDTTFHWYWPSPAMHQRHQALCYYGYRHYTPKTGRWLGRDPIGEVGGVNLFGMCGNDAVNTTDFRGLEIVTDCDISDTLNKTKLIYQKSGNSPFRYSLQSIKDESNALHINSLIIAKMLESKVTFVIAGKTLQEEKDNLKKHVETRAKIVKNASENVMKFGKDDVLHHKNEERPPVFKDNPSDFFDSINNEKTHVGCTAATRYTFFGGIGVADENAWSFRKDDVWIPGDWGYIRNTKSNLDPSNMPTPAIGSMPAKPAGGVEFPSGTEGENLIYLGRENKFWGLGPGNKRKMTKNEWLNLVNSWVAIDRRTKAQAEWPTAMKYPVIGLDKSTGH